MAAVRAGGIPAHPTEEIELAAQLPMGIQASLRDSRFKVLDVVLIAAVCAAAAAVLGKDIARGGLIDPDASAHVMDGVLIHDWVLAGPKAWTDPMRFAREQYGHYPTLGIGGHYPPGFAVVEAAFFLIFGVSATTARLCVVFFGIAAAAGCFVFVRGFAERSTAAIASILLLAVPASTWWGRQVMLEVPLLAALLWAAVAFSYYLSVPGWKRFFVMCLAAGMTVLFKQSGVFLICAIAMTLTFLAIRGRIFKSHAAACVLVAVCVLGGTLATMDDACLKTVSGYVTHAPWSVASMLFYPRSLPELVGVFVLAAAMVGAVLSFYRVIDHTWFLAAWLLVGMAMVTTASLKTPRFAYVVIVPLVVWASMAFGRVLAVIPFPKWRNGVCIAIVVYVAYRGFERPVSDGPDFGAVVHAHQVQIKGEVVLFSGLRDGDFVFSVREQIPWRKCVVMRGSKLFYTCIAGPDLDMVPYSQTQEDLAETMRQFAFPQVFVERDNRVGAPQDDWLRTYLRESGEYAHVDSVLVQEAEGSAGVAVYVDVYRLARPRQRQVDHYDIPIPRTRESIRIDFPTAGISGFAS